LRLGRVEPRAREKDNVLPQARGVDAQCTDDRAAAPDCRRQSRLQGHAGFAGRNWPLSCDASRPVGARIGTSTNVTDLRLDSLAHALTLFQRGDLEAARDVCLGRVEADPGDAAGWHLLGLTEHRRGQTEAALTALARGERLGANAPSQRANHAGVLNAAGRHADALALAEAALASQPDLAPALINAGLAAAATGQHELALMRLLSGLRLRPDVLAVRCRAVESAISLARPDDVLFLMSHPTMLADATTARGLVNRLWTDAPHALRRTLLAHLAARHPDNAAIRYDHAVALHLAGLGGEAYADAEAVLRQAPDNTDAAMMLSVSLFEHGRIGEGLAVLRDLLARCPDHDAAWANYLVSLHYDPTLDQAALLAEHRRWAGCRLAGIEAVPARMLMHDNDAGRPLRVGWLSPRFAQGAVMQFFAGIIPAFDRTFATHRVYHDRRQADPVTESLNASADSWLDVADLDDDALVRQMRDDRLDVIVDLAGHAPHNRMRALAHRVAPIQATWMDYVDTTCVPTMDLMFMDEGMAPAGSEEWADERIVRLQPCRMAYAPAADSPSVDWTGAPDAPFTLACFNRMPKRNAGVFDRYAALLKAMPGSRLVLLDAALEGPRVRAHVEKWLEQRGVHRERIELRGRLSHHDLLQAYRRVDVVIDPFPYSGCTTTCDALWMGVPVLSCPAATFASRQSASFLRAIGRPEWICADEAGLAAAAASLASHPGRRTTLRNELRQAMQSIVCDPRPLVAGMQLAMRKAWRDRCEAADG
jgi:protein O-GlcNAc transferase